MRTPNSFGWVKSDVIVELPDKPFLIWTNYGMDLVKVYTFKEGDNERYGEHDLIPGTTCLISLMSRYWYEFNEVLYYRLDIQGPNGEDLTGIDWMLVSGK